METVVVRHHHLLDSINLGYVSKLGRSHTSFTPQTVDNLVKEEMHGAAKVLLLHRIGFTEKQVLGLSHIQVTFQFELATHRSHLARHIMLGVRLAE